MELAKHSSISMTKSVSKPSDPSNNVIDIHQFRSKNQTIIEVDATCNIYFHMLPQHIATYWYYNVVLSRWYPLTITILIISCTIANLIVGPNVPFWDSIFEIIAWILFGVFAISYCLALNINIMKLIMKTFDFWFKILNGVFSMIAQYALFTKKGTPLATNICALFGEGWMMMVLFMVDAAFVSPKKKLFLEIISIVACVLFALRQYFSGLDVTFNPMIIFGIEDEITNISMKNVFISGLINIALFTIKSTVSIVNNNEKFNPKKKFQRAKSDMQSTSNMNNDDDDDKGTGRSGSGGLDTVDDILHRWKYVAKSTTVHDRPYFKWRNVVANQ